MIQISALNNLFEVGMPLSKPNKINGERQEMKCSVSGSWNVEDGTSNNGNWQNCLLFIG